MVSLDEMIKGANDIGKKFKVITLMKMKNLM